MIFLLMILLHIYDDFVSQPVCLSKLKQKSFWENDKIGSNPMYKDDYKCALFIHGLSWAIMVHLPMIALQFIHGYQWGEEFIVGSVILNALAHTVIDDQKANHYTIDLVCDQILHFIQLVIIYVLWSEYIF